MEEIKDPSENKRNKSNRERETLFRCAYKNQTNLRQIIDNKANIIISINTLFLSSIIAISGFGIITEHMDLQSFNAIPLIIIVLSSLASAILAILSAMPKLIKQKNLSDPVRKQSLIFFGEIVGYSQKEYTAKMEDLLKSKKEIYEHMIIDIYNQGLVLKNKYNLLSYAYKVLMYGFAFGVIGFLILLILN
jgi:hypothetical protein